MGRGDRGADGVEERGNSVKVGLRILKIRCLQRRGLARPILRRNQARHRQVQQVGLSLALLQFLRPSRSQFLRPNIHRDSGLLRRAGVEGISIGYSLQACPRPLLLVSVSRRGQRQSLCREDIYSDRLLDRLAQTCEGMSTVYLSLLIPGCFSCQRIG